MSEPRRVLQCGAASVRIFDDVPAVIEGMTAAMRGWRGALNIALAGGSTPEALYRRWASEPAFLPWHDVGLWFGDERCVPPDHHDSNYRMVRQALLSPLGIEHGQVFRMRGDVSPAQAASDYEAQLRAKFVGDSWPRFDLVLLGVGEDGHTASLFPGTAALHERTRWVVANQLVPQGAWRLTLTLPVLCAAKRAWILATGPRKRDIVRRVFSDQHSGEPWPVQQVVPVAGELVWWLDAAAAADLPGA